MLLLGFRLLHYRTSALYNRFDTKDRIGLDMNRKIIHNRLIFFYHGNQDFFELVLYMLAFILQTSLRE